MPKYFYFTSSVLTNAPNRTSAVTSGALSKTLPKELLSRQRNPAPLYSPRSSPATCRNLRRTLSGSVVRRRLWCRRE